jgi:hypothetical protein
MAPAHVARFPSAVVLRAQGTNSPNLLCRQASRGRGLCASAALGRRYGGAPPGSPPLPPCPVASSPVASSLAASRTLRRHLGRGAMGRGHISEGSHRALFALNGQTDGWQQGLGLRAERQDTFPSQDGQLPLVAASMADPEQLALVRAQPHRGWATTNSVRSSSFAVIRAPGPGHGTGRRGQTR